MAGGATAYTWNVRTVILAVLAVLALSRVAAPQ
jgi:hypothetical protein